MSEAPTPVRRLISAWWLLLLLPVAPLVGWLAGQMPVPRTSAVATSAPGPSSTVVSPWTTFEQAVAESKRTGKPVLVDFNAEWCGPCQALKRGVFDDPDYGPLVQRTVIPVSIVDRAREDGSNTPETRELQQKYDVNAFPTVIVFSPATGRVKKARGFSGADETMTWIVEAAKAVR